MEMRRRLTPQRSQEAYVAEIEHGRSVLNTILDNSVTKCNDMQYTQEMSRKTNEDLLCRLMDAQSTIQGFIASRDAQKQAKIELQTELE